MGLLTAAATALSPYKLAAEVAVFGAVALGIMWGVHTVLDRARETGRQEVRAEWDKAEVARVGAEQRLAAAQGATRDLAVAQGETRDKAITTSAAAVAAAAASVRSAAASQQSFLATATVETARRYSIAASAVSTECIERYRAVAEDAERRASAARTLSESWPTPAPTP